MTTPSLIDHEMYLAAMEAFQRHGKKPASRVGPWVLDILLQCGWDTANLDVGPEQARAKALKALDEGPPRQARASFEEEYTLVTRYDSLVREIRPIWKRWRNPGARDAALRPALERWQGKAWTGPLPSGQTPSAFALKCLGGTEERIRRARRNLETRWRDDLLASLFTATLSSKVELQPNGMLKRRQHGS